MQREAPGEVLNLIQDVELCCSAKIERGPIVFVLSEQGNVIGQEDPYSSQGVEPETRVGASPEANAGQPSPEDSGSGSSVRLKALTGVPDDPVQGPGRDPDMGSCEGSGPRGLTYGNDIDVLLLNVRVGVEKFRFNSQPSNRVSLKQTEFGAINGRPREIQVRQFEPGGFPKGSYVLKCLRDCHPTVKRDIAVRKICCGRLAYRQDPKTEEDAQACEVLSLAHAYESLNLSWVYIRLIYLKQRPCHALAQN